MVKLTANRASEARAKLWRFMDFTKYVSMLDHGALFFTRADRFADPFEGALARKNLEKRHGLESALGARRAARRIFLNSWHQNEHESAAMWRIYLTSGDGVAIQTTRTRLVDSFANREQLLHVGSVRYLDYERDRVPDGDELAPFLCKRKSFEFECETRVLWRSARPLRKTGCYIEADLERLVSRVVVSPNAEPWFGSLVESVTRKYGFDFRVEPSLLNAEPLALSRARSRSGAARGSLRPGVARVVPGKPRARRTLAGS